MVVQVVIVGSSGNVGSATINALKAHSEGLQIHVGVRDPSNPKVAGLEASNANFKIVKADFNDVKGLETAFAGANAVFLIAPGTEDRGQLTLNGIHAAQHAKVGHIVLVSVATAEATSTVFGKQFIPVEEAVKATGIPYTILRLPLFVDNNWGNVGSIKGQGAIYGPVNPEKKFTPVVVADVGEAVSKIFAHLANHVNKTYTFHSPAVTHNEVAQAFSKALGKEVKQVQVSYEDAKKSFIGAGWPEWQVIGILELFHLIDSDSPLLNSTSHDLETVLGHPATTVQQWVQNNHLGFQ